MTIDEVGEALRAAGAHSPSTKTSNLLAFDEVLGWVDWRIPEGEGGNMAWLPQAEADAFIARVLPDLKRAAKAGRRRPSRAEIIRRHREDLKAEEAASKPEAGISLGEGTGDRDVELYRDAPDVLKTPDKLNVEDAEAGLDATALPESQTSNRRDSRERPAPSWRPQWDRPPKSTFRELKNIPHPFDVQKVVLIWRGDDRQRDACVLRQCHHRKGSGSRDNGGLWG